MDRAHEVFRVNCTACHGQDGHGTGPVARYFTQAGWEPPVDFTSQRARSRSDGQLYWFISNGIGNMPNFGDLLSEGDRWALVNVVREVQGQ
jgi:mono/diheme cytochrome c family protein